jgi:prevent-host-death family protein
MITFHRGRVSPVIHFAYMDQVSIRELRNKGGEVLERVARGERLVVTRDGHAVAELRPFARLALSASLLTERWSKLPKVDPERLRCDIDGAIDSRL